MGDHLKPMSDTDTQPDTPESTPFVLNRGGLPSLAFPLCSPGDHFRLRNIFRAYRKAWRADSLRIAGVEGAAQVPHLDEIDTRGVTEDDEVKFVNMPEGAREAVLLSLKRGNAGATLDDVDALGLSDAERLTVAAAVLNFRLVPKGSGSGGGGGNPLPEVPPATGGGTPDESAAGSAAPAQTTP